MLLRFALAAFMGLSACSDNGDGDPVPNPTGVTGAGTLTELRQIATLPGGYAGQIRIVGEIPRMTSSRSAADIRRRRFAPSSRVSACIIALWDILPQNNKPTSKNKQDARKQKPKSKKHKPKAKNHKPEARTRSHKTEARR